MALVVGWREIPASRLDARSPAARRLGARVPAGAEKRAPATATPPDFRGLLNPSFTPQKMNFRGPVWQICRGIVEGRKVVHHEQPPSDIQISRKPREQIRTSAENMTRNGKYPLLNATTSIVPVPRIWSEGRHKHIMDVMGNMFSPHICNAVGLSQHCSFLLEGCVTVF